MMIRGALTLALCTALLPLVAGCGGSDVSSDEDAERAYLGLDRSVDKATRRFSRSTRQSRLR